MPKEARPPWYSEGLRFGCTACGACCTTHGECAYVYLAEGDVRAIAHYLKLERAEFLERYCKRDDGRVILRMDEPACAFLDERKRCRIYPVRPKQCATFPFWEEHLEPARWAQLRTFCPGVDTGPLHPAAEVLRLARETEDWYEGPGGVPDP